jgi:hypothetical protein
MSSDTAALIAKLTLEEKASLLAGVDWWRTAIIKRDDVFVPHIKVSPSATFPYTITLQLLTCPVHRRPQRRSW